MTASHNVESTKQMLMEAKYKTQAQQPLPKPTGHIKVSMKTTSTSQNSKESKVEPVAEVDTPLMTQETDLAKPPAARKSAIRKQIKLRMSFPSRKSQKSSLKLSQTSTVASRMRVSLKQRGSSMLGLCCDARSHFRQKPNPAACTVIPAKRISFSRDVIPRDNLNERIANQLVTNIAEIQERQK